MGFTTGQTTRPQRRSSSLGRSSKDSCQVRLTVTKTPSSTSSSLDSHRQLPSGESRICLLYCSVSEQCRQNSPSFSEETVLAVGKELQGLALVPPLQIGWKFVHPVSRVSLTPLTTQYQQPESSSSATFPSFRHLHHAHFVDICRSRSSTSPPLTVLSRLSATLPR